MLFRAIKAFLIFIAGIFAFVVMIGGNDHNQRRTSRNASSDCTYEYGAVSADNVTRSGEPVVFKMYSCGNYKFRREYVDLNGNSVRESDLMPDPYQRLHDAVEDATGQDLDRPELDRLDELARERGLIE